MKIKICGLNNYLNMKEVEQLNPDMMGLIFYAKSPRFIMNASNLEEIKNLQSIPKTGVFVNEDLKIVEQMVNEFKLKFVQLHGDEDEEYIKQLGKNIKIIKAIKIKDKEDISTAAKYNGTCDYLLFDTATNNIGGSGTKFNWNWLNEYTGETSFLLAGGISIDDVTEIKKLKNNHEQFAGVDLNSRFEVSPGLKNIKLLKEFISCIS